ncbi:hypothetical protein BI364_12110 [Acidihalobacter yilgarnensis]|uniref:DUF4398 domain-containing protein n=1 Tax=Acidihalobacter yilgarnensis TaxID=2819280 RepID=A0A1D8IQ56_9GAMM|nr:DUF4398 domain-containing protein [Acidihalobacter yilgarnensis]AOU98603.1 hypothetical protein BI364_12110 [Acidihalobacter yilgarnensis]
MGKRLIVATLFLSGLLAGCAMAPVQEMSDARQALLAARQAGAATRAPQIYSRAEALMQRAEDQLSVGGYVSAKNLAEAAKKAAQEARDKALLK